MRHKLRLATVRSRFCWRGYHQQLRRSQRLQAGLRPSHPFVHYRRVAWASTLARVCVARARVSEYTYLCHPQIGLSLLLVRRGDRFHQTKIGVADIFGQVLTALRGSASFEFWRHASFCFVSFLPSEDSRLKPSPLPSPGVPGEGEWAMLF